MSVLNQLLDQAIQHCEPQNDSALAGRLGISRSAVSLWRKGEGIRAAHLTELVKIAHADPQIALQVLAEQSASKDARKVWESLLDRLKAAAVACVVVAALLPQQAHATSADAASLTETSYRHYAKWWQIVSRALRSLFTAGTRGFGHGTPAVLA
jgi:transcriptional regulator with XRE-family HTH domain